MSLTWINPRSANSTPRFLWAAVGKLAAPSADIARRRHWHSDVLGLAIPQARLVLDRLHTVAPDNIHPRTVRYLAPERYLCLSNRPRLLNEWFIESMDIDARIIQPALNSALNALGKFPSTGYIDDPSGEADATCLHHCNHQPNTGSSGMPNPLVDQSSCAGHGREESFFKHSGA